MFIDTHCHISKEDYDDIDLVIKENIESKIYFIRGNKLLTIFEQFNKEFNTFNIFIQNCLNERSIPLIIF